MRLFKELDIVSPVHQEELADKQSEIRDYKQREGQDRYLNKANLWNEEAIKLLVRDNFDEAIKCFERAENMKGVKRVRAMKIEKDTNYELFRIEAQFDNPEKLPR
jgi:tetratricopeptide (TPR) repeat protein